VTSDIRRRFEQVAQRQSAINAYRQASVAASPRSTQICGSGESTGRRSARTTRLPGTLTASAGCSRHCCA
jgi:hypothetical protein